MYWPSFEFRYSLDHRKLTPHLMALEAHQQAATALVLPHYWNRPRSETPPDGPSAIPWLKSRNAARARDWVGERFVPGSSPLTLADILTIHRLLSEDLSVEHQTPGTLRVGPVQVGRAEAGGFHSGAPAERLPIYMRRYVEFIAGNEPATLPPAIHSLLAHFFFTTLHPFVDGNGRTSRLVATAILHQRGYNVHGGFYALSDYFYQNGGIRYHTLLHRCWQQGVPFDLTEFVAFGIEGIVMELRSIDSFIRMKLRRAVG